MLEHLISLVIDADIDLSHKIFVDCSTVHPDTVDRLSTRLAQNLASLVSAPVFGGPAIASTGKLIFAVGGDEAACKAVCPWILDIMGRKIILCGDKARSASLLKLGGWVRSLIFISDFPCET